MCPGRAELLEAYELLRKGAPALDDAAGGPVAPGRFRDAHRVEAMMRVEAPILDREECVDHQRRDPLERHVDPLLHEEREHLPVLPVEDDRALGVRADFGERGGVTQLTRHVPGSADSDDCDGPERNRAEQRARDQKSPSHAPLQGNGDARKNSGGSTIHWQKWQAENPQWGTPPVWRAEWANRHPRGRPPQTPR